MGTPLARRVVKPKRRTRPGRYGWYNAYTKDGCYTIEADARKLWAMIGGFRWWATHPGHRVKPLGKRK